MLVCRRKFCVLGRARARTRREDKFLGLASPTEDVIIEGCGWSVVKVVVALPVIEDGLHVTDAWSDCSSGEAGLDGIVVEGGERKDITGSTGCSNIDGVKVGKIKSKSVRLGSESSLSIDCRI